MAEVENTREPPQWLDKNFIQSALRDGLRRGSLNVNTCNIKPAVKVGSNFLSQIFRVSANIDSKRKGAENISVVVKSLPKGELVEQYVHDSEYFSLETKMLAETLPLLHEILSENGLKKKLFAEMYYHQGSPNDLIILEDLCQSGFLAPNRCVALDLNHTNLVLESLAAFHASSLVAMQRDPTIKTNFVAGFWHRKNEKVIRPFLMADLDHVADRLEVWGNWSSDLPDKIRNLKNTVLEKLYESIEKIDDEFNVLNHGDSWTSNLMFKYSENVPVDMRFVDFQLSCYGSPMYDLIYFIFSSVANDIKVSHIDHFLQHYHSKLTEFCQAINYPLNLKLEELKQCFLRRLFYGFVISVVVFPFQFAPQANDLNDFLQENAEYGNEMYLTDNFKEGMEQVFPYFIKHGVFD